MHSNSDQSDPESDKTRFGKYSEQVQKKLSKSCKRFCKDADLEIVFTSFEINKNFSTTDKVPYFLKSFQFIDLLVQDVFLGTLAKPVATLKLESMNM